MTTAGQWPWKPASAKECVTAHQPNGIALKMDEVQPVLAIPYRVPDKACKQAYLRYLGVNE